MLRREHVLVPSRLSTIPGLSVCPTGPAHTAGARLRCHQPTTGDSAKVHTSRLEMHLEMELGGRAVWLGWRKQKEKSLSPALEPLAAPLATSTVSPAAQRQLSPLHDHPEPCLLTPLCPLAYLPWVPGNQCCCTPSVPFPLPQAHLLGEYFYTACQTFKNKPNENSLVVS